MPYVTRCDSHFNFGKEDHNPILRPRARGAQHSISHVSSNDTNGFLSSRGYRFNLTCFRKVQGLTTRSQTCAVELLMEQSAAISRVFGHRLVASGSRQYARPFEDSLHAFRSRLSSLFLPLLRRPIPVTPQTQAPDADPPTWLRQDD